MVGMVVMVVEEGQGSYPTSSGGGGGGGGGLQGVTCNMKYAIIIHMTMSEGMD